MDYSLLLCIEKIPIDKKPEDLSINQFLSKNNEHLYHIAVIDYLQDWNLNKKGERLLKTKIQKKDGAMLSEIEPNEY